MRLIRLAETFAYGGSVAIILLIAATLDPRGWRVLPRPAICAYGAGLATDAIKFLLIARTRPEVSDLSSSVGSTFIAWFPPLSGETFERLNLDYDTPLQSFPSGHTATAVGLAIALSSLYPRGWWLFAALAALAGAQRIIAESHFLSDVLAGAAIGCLVGACATGATVLGRWLARLEAPPARLPA